MSVSIRPARERDLPILHDIERECFPNNPWEMHQMLQDDCTVAEWDGYIAGFLMSRQILPSWRGSPPEREILNVAVSGPFRRLGIAHALLRYELDTRRAHHFLEVRESNSAARKLYGKVGFAEVGRRPAYYQYPEETAIVMSLKWC